MIKLLMSDPMICADKLTDRINYSPDVRAACPLLLHLSYNQNNNFVIIQ